MFLHVEHAQVLRKGTAWCGVSVIGPRVIGIENFLYHSEQERAGPICPGCLQAMLDRFGAAVRKVNSCE